MSGVRRELVRHPATPCEAVDGIVVEVERVGPRLALHYRLTGRPEALVLPPPAPPVRTDELWRHTCFEAFVRPQPGEGYVEVNLAPSGQWAAYAFDGYRAGMRPAEVGEPGVLFARTADGLRLEAALELADAAPWRLGLTAVIEEVGGRISYWSLAHPAGKPDFHSPDCLALELPAPLGA